MLWIPKANNYIFKAKEETILKSNLRIGETQQLKNQLISKIIIIGTRVQTTHLDTRLSFMTNCDGNK